MWENFRKFWSSPSSIVLVLILLMGSFLRFFKLGEIPCGLFPDQALNGLDGLRFVEGFISPVFGSKEGLFVWLVGFFQMIFGVGMWQVFAVSAVVGVFSVMAIYLVSKELIDEKYALICSGLIAVSGWHIVLSRNGFRAGLIVVFMALIFWAYLKLKKSEKKSKFRWSVLLGLLLGLGFYTYNVYWVFVFLFAGLGLIDNWLNWKRIFSNNSKFLVSGVLTFLFVISPILAFALFFPDMFFGRAGDVSVWNSSQGFDVLWKVLDNFKEALSGLFWGGDLNLRHDLSGVGFLNYFLWPFFLLGVVEVIRTKRWWFLIGFVFMFLPSVLTNEGYQPHGLRMIGVLPFMIGIVGLALYKLDKFDFGKYVVFIVITMVGVSSFYLYFITSSKTEHFYYDYRCDLTDIGRDIDLSDVLVVGDDFTFQTVRYLNYGETVVGVSSEEFLLGESYADEIIVTSHIGEFNEQVLSVLRDTGFEEEFFINEFGKVDYYYFRK